MVGWLEGDGVGSYDKNATALRVRRCCSADEILCDVRWTWGGTGQRRQQNVLTSGCRMDTQLYKKDNIGVSIK